MPTIVLCKCLITLLIALILYCNKPISAGCSDCLSPSVEITFLDTKTKQTLFPDKVIAVHNSKDTVVFIRNQRRDTNSIIILTDSTYLIYFGPGTIDIAFEDSLYGAGTIPNLQARRNDSYCKEMIIQCLTVQLEKNATPKKTHGGMVIKKTEKLGC